VSVPEATLLGINAGLLLVGLGVAAVLDVRDREVPDSIWIVLAGVGTVVGGVGVATGGWVPILLWLLAAGFVFEHLVPWDSLLGGAESADYVELGIYLGVLAVLAGAVVKLGIGPGQVPVTVIVVVISVLFARALFESGILFGGADAKAVMVAGLLVPIFATPLLPVPASILPATAFLPFAVDLLLDAALVSVAVPLALGILNASRGEFHLRGGFTSYTIPVAELPRRWVWVRDPSYPVDRVAEEAIETSEEDVQWRTKIAAELAARGTTRVRVGPQLPFIVFLSVGAVAAVAFGNLVLDFLVLL
jgi:hypothetical protein